VNDVSFASGVSLNVGHCIIFIKQGSKRQRGSHCGSSHWPEVIHAEQLPNRSSPLAARSRLINSSQWQKCCSQGTLRRCKGSGRCLMLAASGGTLASPQLQTHALNPWTVFSPLLARDPAPEVWRNRKRGKHGRLTCLISVVCSSRHVDLGPRPTPITRVVQTLRLPKALGGWRPELWPA
jgi:hypothetical protein